MALYEYVCKECGSITEIIHDWNKNPHVECINCGKTNTHRIPSVFSMNTNNYKKPSENKHIEMKQELKEKYGIEHIKMERNTLGKSFEDIYKDIKNGGSAVNEAMKAQREMNQKNTKQKQREWMKGALRRTPKRWKEKRELKAKEDAKKRAIIVSR